MAKAAKAKKMLKSAKKAAGKPATKARPTTGRTAVKPVPEGYRSVTPYLTVRDGAGAIDFYKRAFGAVEKERMPGPDGKSLMHAELKIGDSILMLSDELPQPGGTKSPQSLGGASGSLFLYVRDVDSAFQRAVGAGCQVTMPLADMFWGDRFGRLVDPFGHHWGLATHKEDVSPPEMKRRAGAAFGGGAGSSG